MSNETDRFIILFPGEWKGANPPTQQPEYGIVTPEPGTHNPVLDDLGIFAMGVDNIITALQEKTIDPSAVFPEVARATGYLDIIDGALGFPHVADYLWEQLSPLAREQCIIAGEGKPFDFQHSEQWWSAIEYRLERLREVPLEEGPYRFALGAQVATLLNQAGEYNAPQEFVDTVTATLRNLLADIT